MTTMSTQCPERIAVDDLGAWVHDHIPHDRVDLRAHVTGCLACSAEMARLAHLDTTLEIQLRGGVDVPGDLAERAIARIRLDRLMVDVLGTVADAVGRSGAAIAHYSERPERDGRRSR